ncbi:MAG: dipeptide/oligopeptide/nickel ABC transporter ATP-binding protein [Peptococcaceae bacterium]|nr:dipeptide/oligopeptide/nickel ABC transporter ATP-binding protein [Peptococcaceae bacterium]
MLKVDSLSKVFKRGLCGRNSVCAVNNVSFTVSAGEKFGLVGPSGSGKSTLARLLLRLIEPSGGSVFFRGTEITSLSRRKFQPYRRKMQIIFQQPALSLDPRKTVYQSITEPLLVHRLVKSKSQAMEKALELLSLTSLAEEVLFRYPCQISGGQAQRVAIARALGLEPEIIIADEPTSMLDVSVQAQVMQLLDRLQRERGITVILISHDIALVKAFCRRAALLEGGRLTTLVDSRELQVVKQSGPMQKLLKTQESGGGSAGGIIASRSVR